MLFRAILRDALAWQAKAPQDEGCGLWLRMNNISCASTISALVYGISTISALILRSTRLRVRLDLILRSTRLRVRLEGWPHTSSMEKRVIYGMFRHCERSDAIQNGGAALDCFVAEPVIGPATSGRTRWLLAMTRNSVRT